MNILSIDSSAKAASAAVVKDGVLLCEYFLNNGLTHSCTLTPMIKSVLDSCNMTAGDIDCYAVNNGPGSFTGVRIGVSTIKGLAMDTPCVGVSTLLSLAYNVRGVYDGLICSAMDARRNQTYSALFMSENEKIVRITEDSALSLDELMKAVIDTKKIPVFVGDGAKMCYNSFVENGIPCRTAPENLLFQRASSTAYAVLYGKDECERMSASALAVNYLRLSQAERELINKNRK